MFLDRCHFDYQTSTLWVTAYSYRSQRSEISWFQFFRAFFSRQGLDKSKWRQPGDMNQHIHSYPLVILSAATMQMIGTCFFFVLNTPCLKSVQRICLTHPWRKQNGEYILLLTMFLDVPKIGYSIHIYIYIHVSICFCRNSPNNLYYIILCICAVQGHHTGPRKSVCFRLPWMPP